MSYTCKCIHTVKNIFIGFEFNQQIKSTGRGSLVLTFSFFYCLFFGVCEGHPGLYTGFSLPLLILIFHLSPPPCCILNEGQTC